MKSRVINTIKRVKPIDEELEELCMEKKYNCEYCNEAKNQELIHNKLNEYTMSDLVSDIHILMEGVKNNTVMVEPYLDGKLDAFEAVLDLITNRGIN